MDEVVYDVVYGLRLVLRSPRNSLSYLYLLTTI